MLPTALLTHRKHGEEITPKRLRPDSEILNLVNELLDLFRDAQGDAEGELDERLADLEADSTDYKLMRGLAHIIKSGFCTFEVVSPLEPDLLRRRVFADAAAHVANPAQTERVIERLADDLTHELGRTVLRADIRKGLYADLSENKLLTAFDEPAPESVVHRYNLAQVQGVFYRASRIIINAYRNDPGEYKLLFRYLKLFRLMAYVEGDADHGFTLTIDGPTSLFRPSTRYGLDLAKLIPALLHVTKWNLVADLELRDTYNNAVVNKRFTLDSESGLVSHYPPGKEFDSMVEESFADSWARAKTEWRLEREVELVPLPGSVMIPDFRLTHPDGRSFLLEIVGYWRPEYLRKKFWQVQRAARNDLILAVSERLNLEKAGVNVAEVPTKVVWYKDQLPAKTVLAALED